MQRILCIAFLILWIVFCSVSYSQPAPIASPIFHDNSLQAASFAKKSNALRYQQTLQKNSQYPVRVIRKNIRGKIFYRVMIGPMPSKLIRGNMSAKVFSSQKGLPSPISKKIVLEPVQKPLPFRQTSSPKRALVVLPGKSKWATFARDNEYTLLLGGTYIPNTIKGETLQLLPYELGSYADTFTQQSDSGGFSWGLGLGHRFYLNPASKMNNLFDSFAINAQFFQLISANQTGHVVQFGLPEFENYTYSLGISNYRFMADGDLDFHPIHNVVGFIEGGIGGASTTLSYGSASIAPVLNPGLALPKQTNWSFAYQAGAGFKVQALSQLELSLRYLYANMGTANSSIYGSTDTLAMPLKADMSTHNILFGLAYKGDYVEK